jgi:hypothetical protein
VIDGRDNLSICQKTTNDKLTMLRDATRPVNAGQQWTAYLRIHGLNSGEFGCEHLPSNPSTPERRENRSYAVNILSLSGLAPPARLGVRSRGTRLIDPVASPDSRPIPIRFERSLP